MTCTGSLNRKSCTLKIKPFTDSSPVQYDLAVLDYSKCGEEKLQLILRSLSNKKRGTRLCRGWIRYKSTRSNDNINANIARDPSDENPVRNEGAELWHLPGRGARSWSEAERTFP